MKRPILILSSVPFVGGAEISMLTTAKALSADLYQVVFAVPEEGEFADKIRAAGFPVEILGVKTPNLYRRINHFKCVRSIIKVIDNYKIQLLHINSFPFLMHGIMATRFRSMPVVCHIRDLISPGWFRLHHQWAAKRVDRYLCITKHVEAVFHDRFAHDLIYNGIDLSAFPKQATGLLRQQFDLGDAPLVGIVGYQIERKGHRVFVDAAQAVLQQHPATKFVIIGKDPLPGQPFEKELKDKISQAGLTEHFVFTGYLDTIDQVMGDLTVLCVPSWDEPFGRNILESFASHVPVIASNVGGPVEIITHEHDGLLLPPQESAKWSDAINALLADDKLCERYANAGYETVVERFSAAVNAQHVARVYEELLV